MAATADNREAVRMESLHQYRILDSEPEKAFDDLTLLAAHICDAPIALVSLVDEQRQWFKSKLGLAVTQMPREISFCAHAIQQQGTFVVADASEDARFRGNPLVNSEPKIRFYAGVPIISREGQALGTLCVIDRVPRHLSEAQSLALAALARQVQTQMELRRNLMELEAALERRDEAEAVRDRLIGELRQQLANVKRLSGLLPLSSTCKLDMTIPADINSIDSVVNGVLALTEQMHAAEGKDLEVETAIREALANAIVHGCKQDASKQVQCSVACDYDGDLLVVIRDSGPGFDLSTVPDPTESETISQAHGRGLYLINQLVDDVEFIVRKSGMSAGTGTEVRFRAGKRL